MQIRRVTMPIVVACLFCVLVVGVAVLSPSPPAEPIYKGRTLSDWLDFWQHPSRDWEHREEAAIAVKNIGTNALPFLLRWMRGDPAWRLKLRIALGKLPNAVKRASGLSSFTDQPDFGQLAVAGFLILGSDAAPAVPELTRLLNQTHSWQRQHWTIQALGSIGKEGLPALAEALRVPGNQHQELIIERIAWIGGAGTNSTLVIPLLISSLTNSSCAKAAVQALGNIGREPGIIIPALTNCLESAASPSLRLAAIDAIKRFGTNGSLAVPSLVRANEDSNYFVQAAASDTLRVISPQTPRKVVFGP